MLLAAQALQIATDSEDSMTPTPEPQSFSVPAALRAIQSDGFVHVPQGGVPFLLDLLEAIGKVIHVEEVVVAPESRSLVKSGQGLSLHTDHHRADRIVWHCIAQSDQGGETVLADARVTFATLSPAQREQLGKVELEEHSIFVADRDRHPVVTWRGRESRFYYSYWLADAGMTAEAKAAFDAFAAAVDRAKKLVFRLSPGDILAIDNGRMLHGRMPIEGSQARHLRRYWLSVPAGG